MHQRSPRPGLALLLLLAACSDSDKPAGTAATLALASAPDVAAVAQLVPRDTTYVARIESVRKVNALVQRLASDTGLQLPAEPVKLLAAMLGVDPSVVVEDQPLYVALGLEAGPSGLPPVTLIAPTLDPQTVAASYEQGGTATTDQYVAFSQDPEYTGGGSDLLNGMPGGTISLRCDSAGLRERYRAEIEEFYVSARQFYANAMSTPEQASTAKLAESMLLWAEEISNSAQTIDVSLSERSGEFDLHAAIHTDGKGPLARFATSNSGIAELGSALPPGMAMRMLLRLNLSDLSEFSKASRQPLLSRLPPQAREKLEAYMQRLDELNAALGGEWAIGFDILDSGFRAAVVGTAKDADAYMRGYTELLRSPVLAETGMRFSVGPARKAGDVEITTWRVHMDVAKYAEITGIPANEVPAVRKIIDVLFGKDGLLVETAVHNGRIYFSAGSESILNHMLKASGEPRWIAEEQAGLPGE